MTTDDLTAMSRRGEEDGHDRKWYPTVTRDRRQLDAMIRAANEARARLQSDEAAFVPSRFPVALIDVDFD
jgi:hypothetical protein